MEPLRQFDPGHAPAPLWQATAPASPPLLPLGGDSESEVLVIGGGIAGLSTALHLAEAGIDALLLEAGQPGTGATGQSGGLIAPDYIRHSPDSILQSLGDEAGERMTRFIGESAAASFDLIQRHGIDCDARQDGFYSPVQSRKMAEAQHHVAAQWQARGFDVFALDARETEDRLGSPLYHGALHFPSGGSINPLAYARGLARAAAAAGARLHGGTPVEHLAFLDGWWQARTPHGRVRARKVVLAANGGNSRLHRDMRHSVLPLHVVEFATAPIAPRLRRSILSEGGAFTDKSPYVFTARYDAQGRLISAFPQTFLVRSDRAFRAEARRRLVRSFPGRGFENVKIESFWQGVAWINGSLLPEIHGLGDGAFAIQACNGRGLSINTALGMELARALARDDMDLWSVIPRRPRPFRLYPATARLPMAMMTMAYLSD